MATEQKNVKTSTDVLDTPTEGLISAKASIAAASAAAVKVITPDATAAIVSAPVVAAVADTDNITVAGKIALQSLADYIENMKPRRPLSNAEGSRYQLGLYRTLTNIINNLDSDFGPVFRKTLKLFEENQSGALHETYVFRFMDTVALAEKERKSFQRLLNLIKLAAPVQGRDVALRQVDFTSSLDMPITEAGRQRVLAFFNK